MNEIVSTLAGVSVKTMSSVELVQIINELRPEGAAELRHDNFVTKIEKHPGIQSPKFLGHVEIDIGNGNSGFVTEFNEINDLDRKDSCYRSKLLTHSFI